MLSSGERSDLGCLLVLFAAIALLFVLVIIPGRRKIDEDCHAALRQAERPVDSTLVYLTRDCSGLRPRRQQ